MKRLWKQRLATLAAACAIVLCLAACGGASDGGSTANPIGDNPTVAELIAAAQANETEVDSMCCNLVLTMTIGLDDESIAMTSTGDIDYVLDPMVMRQDMTVDMGDYGTTHVLSYAAEENGMYVTYSGVATGEDEYYWVKQTTADMDAIAQYDAKANMEEYLDIADNFRIVGRETVNGRDAWHIAGVFTGDDLSQVLESSGVLSSINIDADTATLLVDNMGDLPIDIWITADDCLPVKYEMDLTDLVQKLVAAVLVEDPGQELVNISQMHLSMTVTEINTLDEIVIPEEALAATEIEL